MAQIFVSYSRNDAETVTRLLAELHNAGHTTWFDTRTIAAGDDWKRSIERGIDDCEVVLLALSHASAMSDWVGRELDFAHARHKPILPVMLEPVPSDDIPAVLHKVNANIIPAFPVFQDAIRKLLFDLRGVPPCGRRIPFIVDHPRLMHFVGRISELNLIRETLNQPGPPVGLIGMGGCGKTQLAVEYAHRHRYFYPDGIFLLDATAAWEAEFARIALRLGLKMSGLGEGADYTLRAAAAFVAYVNDHREALVIFDNVIRPEEIVRRRICLALTASLLPCRMLFTTRVRFEKNSLRSLEIGPIDAESATSMLIRGRPDLSSDSNIGAACQALGYLPFALDLAAAFLRKKPAAGLNSYLTTLREHGLDTTNAFAGLQERDIEAYCAASLTPALNAQWALLECRETEQILQVVSGHRENARVPIPRLAAMTGLRDESSGIYTPLADGIRDGANANLLDVLDGEVVRMHPLSRDFVNRRPDRSRRKALSDAVERLATAYEDAAELERQCAERTADAVEADLLAALALLSENDSEEIRFRIRILSKAFRKEAHSLRGWDQIKNPAYFAQQIFDRCTYEGPAILAETARERLSKLNAPHLKCSFRSRVESSELERTLTHRDVVLSAMVAPSGTYAASRVLGDTVHVWDLELGTLQFTIPEIEFRRGPLGYIKRGGRGLVATTPSGGWNLETGEPDFLPGGDAEFGCIDEFAFSETGLYSAALSEDNWIHIYDHRLGIHKRLVQVESEGRGSLAVTDRTVWYFRNHPESGWTLRGWNISTGALICALKGNDGLGRTFAVSPDDRKAVFAYGSRLQVWDLDRRSRLHDMSGHTASVKVITVAGDNRTAVSGGNDSTVIVWNLETGKADRILFGHGSLITAVAVSLDVRTAISSSWDRTVKVWNLSGSSTAKFEEGHSAAILSLAVSADGRLGLTGCELGQLTAWDLSEGRFIRVLARPASSPFLTAIAISVNGRWAVSTWSDGTLKLWDLVQLREELSISVRPNAEAAAVTDDGRRVLLSYGDGGIELYDLNIGGQKSIFNPAAEPNYSGSPSPSALTRDGRWVVTCFNRKTSTDLLVIDGATGETRCVASSEPTSNSRIAITPDLQYALSGVEVFNLREERRVCLLAGIPRAIHWCSALNCEGDLAAAGFSDGSLRIWETAAGKEICLMTLTSEAHRITFLPDGRSLLIGDQAGGVQLLHLSGYRTSIHGPRQEVS